MSRRARHSRTVSLTPSPGSRNTSLDDDRVRCMSDGILSASKSLTPHRKHHKLLKDGSEVWSEDVERVFVQGLREYWESPWATYSRGRSRWRNQFLVEHLKKAGIERSKKQVASHIQVLRNMWRGEPEFHLVAGGEELFAEDGLLASPTRKGTSETRDQLPATETLEAMSSASSATPDYPAPEALSHSSSSTSFPHDCSPLTRIPSTSNAGHTYDAYSSVSSAIAVPRRSPPASPSYRAPVKLEPLHVGGAGLYTLPASPLTNYLGGTDPSPVYPILQPHNRVLGLSLWTDGMTMFTADADRISAALAIPQPAPQEGPTNMMLRIRISISSSDDVHSLSSAHGFQGAVSLAARWNTEARCVTSIYAGRTCVGQEVAYLEPHQATTAEHGPSSVTVGLPDSTLSRCRWLDKSHDLITQQLVVDGIVLGVFLYHLERASGGPSAELVGFQRRRAVPTTGGSRPPSQTFSPSVSPSVSSLGTSPPSGFFAGNGYAMYAPAPVQRVAAQPTSTVPLPPSASASSLFGANPPAERMYYHPVS